MLTYHIRKKFYQANSANLTCSFGVSRTGINLTFKGYNEKMEMFIEMYLKELKNVVEIVNESSFDQYVATQKENFINGLRQVRGLGREYTSKILAAKFHLDYDMFKVLDQINHLDVQRFVPKLFKRMKIKILAQGNITADQTKRVVNIFETNLDCQPYDEVCRPLIKRISYFNLFFFQPIDIRKRAYKLPPGKSFIRLKSLQENDDNSYIGNIYQIGPKNLKNYAMAKILRQFVDPKTYDYLRSKYQLGYAVGCGIDLTGEIMGFNIVVLSQEHKHRFNAVQIKIDDFIENTITNAIDELTDEDFGKLKDAHIKELQAEVLTLDAEVTSNYNEISDEFYLFNRKELSAEITRGISKIEFQQFYHSFMDRDKQRVLCTHVIGNDKRQRVEETDENSQREVNDLKIEFITESFTNEFVIKNIEAFQNEMELYPAIRSHL